MVMAARTETWFSLVLRVGPSNVERIVALLGERLSLEPDAARSLLSRRPCELEVGTDESKARTLARDVIHAGGQADIAHRTVELPQVSVFLEEVGGNKLAAIVAIRQYVDLSIQEARQLVERTPIMVVESMEEPLALELVAALQKAGARTRVA
jgi:ribosomal protein L7/L12